METIARWLSYFVEVSLVPGWSLRDPARERDQVTPLVGRCDGIVLSKREDDGRRTCRTLWRCTGRHVWWRWADRPNEPLEVCPVPELLR